MIDRFTIRNFRCFRDFSIDGLGRVNLVMGKNNSGKSSLLEALFVHHGSHRGDIGLLVNALRGILLVSSNSLETWGWLFRNRDTSCAIEIVVRQDDGEEETVRMFLDDVAVVPFTGGMNGMAGVAGSGMGGDHRPLAIERSRSTGITERINVRLEEAGVMVDRSLTSWGQAVIVTTQTRTPGDLPIWFSNLDSQNRQREVEEPLRLLEPRLRRLSTRALPPPGGSVVQVDLGGKEHVPLAFAGDGMSRLLSHLLAIAEAKNGIALLDEIENGLHYAALPGVWKAIADAARRSNTQVFATTHSLECVSAAHEAFKESDTYDLRVHRIDLEDDGMHRVATFDEENLETALDQNWEVR